MRRKTLPIRAHRVRVLIVIGLAASLAVTATPARADHLTVTPPGFCYPEPTNPTQKTCIDPAPIPPTVCVEPFGCKDPTHTLPTPIQGPIEGPIEPIEWHWNACVPPIQVETARLGPVTIDASPFGQATIEVPGASAQTSEVCGGLYPYPDPTPSNGFCVPGSVNVPLDINWPDEIIPPPEMPGPPPACVSPNPVSNPVCPAPVGVSVPPIDVYPVCPPHDIPPIDLPDPCLECVIDPLHPPCLGCVIDPPRLPCLACTVVPSPPPPPPIVDPAPIYLSGPS